MEKFIGLSIFLLILMTPQFAVSAQETRWHQFSEDGTVLIDVYFFWSNKCPHCLEARPFIEQLSQDNPWIVLHDFQVIGEPEHVRRYQQITEEIGAGGSAVPAFLYCGQLVSGFDEEMALSISEDLIVCREHVLAQGNSEGFASSVVVPEEALVLALPLVGELQVSLSSMGLITVMLASVDAFNPCAFFVLMLLLSMMLHTGSRKKMLIVGGVFLFFSGFMYFLFMSAWLNLFLVLGRLDLLTMIAAVVAITIGAINIKDYFWFRKGVSIGISDDAKPGLYQRMRAMLRTDSLPTLLLATAGLAFFANLYEFFCTAGFPMLFTRILTLNETSTTQYYLYLLMYNVIYIIPLLVIVLLFAFTMGDHRLQESQGRILKLISGLMMLLLGGVLLVEPERLMDLGFILGLMLLAIGAGVIAVVWSGIKRRSQ